MSRSRFPHPADVSATPSARSLAAARAGIVDPPSGHGLVEDVPAKSQDDRRRRSTSTAAVPATPNTLNA